MPCQTPEACFLAVSALSVSERRFIVRPRKASFGRVWGEALKKAQGVSKVVTLKRGASRWPEVEGWVVEANGPRFGGSKRMLIS